MKSIKTQPKIHKSQLFPGEWVTKANTDDGHRVTLIMRQDQLLYTAPGRAANFAGVGDTPMGTMKPMNRQMCAKYWREHGQFWRDLRQTGNEQDIARACDELAQWHEQESDEPSPVMPRYVTRAEVDGLSAQCTSGGAS
jgi:hypothetical protein